MKREPSSVERQAIGLYAVLARDPGDFIEMVDESSDDTLRTLYLMLTTDHPNHTRDDRELNDLGGRIVKARLERRGLSLPKALDG